MSRGSLWLLALLLMILLPSPTVWRCSVAAKPIGQTHADLIIDNAFIYTMDGARSIAQCIAIGNGKILFVGSNADAAPFAGPMTRIVDMSGKMILPGFHDSHAHPATGYLEREACDLSEMETKDQIAKTISNYAKEHASSTWITGGGWALPIYADAAPSKEELDTIVPDKPVFLYSQDGHSAWLNSKALEAANITSQTPDPFNGRIERKGTSKEPSGTLRESAIKLVKDVAPAPTDADYRNAVLEVQKEFNRFGIVGVQDAGVDETLLKAYSSLDESNLLTMRVHAAMIVEPGDADPRIEELKKWRDKYDGKTLKVNSVKLWCDGVLETGTAALIEPYLGNANTQTSTGMLNFPQQVLNAVVARLDAEGFQVHIHAIGDGAVRSALNAHAFAQSSNGWRDRRHHIAHLELIHPEDLTRFRDMNIIANYQPFWAYRDAYVKEQTEPKLGPVRSRRLYQIASMIRSGAVVVAGSDWNVTTQNPLDAIQVAVTRCGLTAPAATVMMPEEKTTLAEILSCYTINGAFLSKTEKETGSLEVGKSADFVVLDKNLFSIPPSQIHKAKVLLTMFKGREVYRATTFDTE